MQNQYPPNQLAQETSPYLLQHAHNPVAWHPWNEAALELARREDKPILLSIGYSACHWCHVMAHESFEDSATAEVMNARFINIKVDREEHPELDKIYQLSHQLLSRRSGGWPLTIFLNPDDLIPFFSGTYFPKESRYNLPSFISVLEKVSDYYAIHQETLAEGKAAFVNALNAMGEHQASTSTLESAQIAQVCETIEKSFDTHWGGFGGAPKFPHISLLDFLLRLHLRKGDAKALHMSTYSLSKMAEGGIYDQLGGGFCRYSVDAEWNIPHFEKMLYDNGPLLGLYSQAWQVAQNPLYRKVAIETAEWALREMQSLTGGFYSSLDADSEGHEGKFYAWLRQEVKSLLTDEEFSVFALHYGLSETPNFEDRWHLFVSLPLPECANRLGINADVAEALLNSARHTLFMEREKRVHPGRDDKILTAWNALMIKGMAIAGRVFAREDFISAAVATMDFLRQELYPEGRLQATWKEGRARLPAYLDDHAFLLDAVLELLQTRWQTSLLEFAIRLADDLLALFEDKANGGFFFTAHDHTALIHRPKSMMDESMASGNGIAAFALNRLGHLLGQECYTLAAERTLQIALQAMTEYPVAYGSLLNAVDDWSSPPQIIILRGQPDEMANWERLALEHYVPGRLCFAIPSAAISLPGLVGERKPHGNIVAYICAATSCLPPVTSLEDFQHWLNQ